LTEKSESRRGVHELVDLAQQDQVVVGVDRGRVALAVAGAPGFRAACTSSADHGFRILIGARRRCWTGVGTGARIGPVISRGTG
jgi:hypothetical protein